MTYCDVSLVRSISGLGSGEIRDQRIRDLRDDVAIPRMNDDIQTRVESEKITSISNSKENDIDGENKTFYLGGTHNNYNSLGDLNDDGVIDEKDIHAWAIIEDEKEAVKINSIVDADEGEFTAVRQSTNSPLPKGADLYVRYRHAPVNVSEPNQMIAIACAQLTGAFCFSNIETSKLKNFTIGDVTIRKQTQGFGLLMDQYTESMRRIVNRELIKFDENVNEVEDVLRGDAAGDEPLGHGKNIDSGRHRSG